MRTLQALESKELLRDLYEFTDQCLYADFRYSAENQRKHLLEMWISYCSKNLAEDEEELDPQVFTLFKV